LFPNANPSSASLDLKSQFKNQFHINFVYGFSHNNNSYILTQQPIGLRDSDKIITKLIRISRTDETLFSYKEIELICEVSKYSGNQSFRNPKNENKIHYKASTAYFGEIGSKQYEEFEIHNEGDSHTLFVAFNPIIDDMNRNKTIVSTFCAFTMKMIETAFLSISKNTSQTNLNLLKNWQNLEIRNDLYVDNKMISINEPIFGLFLNSFEGIKNFILFYYLIKVKLNDEISN
jgi:hypothetical protein